MGTKGVTAGLEVTVTGLIVTKMVSFPSTEVLKNEKICQRIHFTVIAMFATVKWT